MFNYKYYVKLNYEYYDGSPFPRNINYNYDDFLFQDEEYKAKIKFKKNFELEIYDIIASNNDEAFSYACKCIDRVCKTVTILLQFQNYDNRRNSPNLTYMPSNIKLLNRTRINLEGNCSGVNCVSSHMDLSDNIGLMRISEGLDLNNFEKIYRLFSDIKSLNIGEIVYRAALSKNIESRFFQLFTIIEAIETKYNEDKDISNKMICIEEFDKLESVVSDGISTLSLDEKYAKRLKSRLIQIIKSATIQNRAEKLSAIIIMKFDIRSVRKGMVSYKINAEKMQEFISARN